MEMGAVTGQDRQPHSTGELIPSQGEKSSLTAFGLLEQKKSISGSLMLLRMPWHPARFLKS